MCRPSNSPWASNVVLVSKKDGKQRFAIDYRKLNEVTRKDAYSIPRIQTILDKLHGNRFFSVIDISSAYWSVPVREADIEKTAFNTPRGLYEMTVMPFGLVNSQAIFQRLMDNTLRGLKHTDSYIDDCIIYSHSLEEHIEDLRDVLERMKQANIHLNFKKCQFGYQEVEFLGHLVSERGRRPIATAARKLAKFPTPGGVTELQRFLGSFNFYRGYIPNLATIAEPLYQLTKKEALWEWSQERETAFKTLREKLVKEPVMLRFPNWSRNFTVETDASCSGVAGLLSQRDGTNGEFRPIDYFSSSPTPSQINYSAGQLEAWTMVAACRKCSVYLRGSEKVELITYHNPLRWLRYQRDPRRTYARWIMELEEYNHEISYRSGIQNALPDYLSRIPRQPIDDQIQDEDIFEAKVFTIQHTSERLSIMSKRQKEDPVTSLAIEQLRRGKVVQGQLRRVNAHLHLERDVLFFDARIVVPKSEQEQVLREVHAAGHLVRPGR